MLDIVVSCPSHYTLCKIYILFQALSTCIDEHCFVLAEWNYIKTIVLEIKQIEGKLKNDCIRHQ